MIRFLLICSTVLLLAAGLAHAQTCPPNSEPQFSQPSGNVFGSLSSQWQAYFGAKADANNGTLCQPTLTNPIVSGIFTVGSMHVTGSFSSPSLTDAGSGVTIGAPTGGAEGNGSLNMQFCFIQGVPCATASGGGVVWPATRDLVISNTTSTPFGLAPVVNSLLYANSGGSWAALPSASNGILTTNGGGVPSIGTTLPSGLTAAALTVTGSFTATGLVTNADIANPSVTVSGVTCTLGSTCAPPTGAIAVGTTVITGASSNGMLYNSSGVLQSVATTVNNGVLITGPSGNPSISATIPSGITAPALVAPSLVVTGSLTATGLVTNADLVNASTTVNGQTCVLGSTCTITASSGSVTIGTTTIVSGTSNGLLYDSAGVVGNLATANNGVLGTSGSGVPSISTTLPSGLTAPSLVVTTGFTATGLVTNADLANASTTVNGTTCTLGSTCSVTATATSITVGTTTIASGVANGLLYDSAGVLGNLATANNGVLVTSAGGVPSIGATLPSGLTIPSPVISGTASGTGTIPTTMLAGAITGIQMPALPLGDVYQGNGSNVATAVTMSAALNAGIGSVASELLYNNAGTWAQLATVNNGVLKTSGAGVPSISTTLPSGLTAPSLTVTTAFTATGLVTNADLVNASTTVNGQTCTLGATCAISSALTVASTTITGGTSAGILYNNAGFLGNLVTALNGVLVTNGSGIPSISTTFPSGLSAPSLTVTTAFTATGLVTNADLVNASTTVNGQVCTLGSTCTITASAGTITVGTTTIASGTTNGLLYDNAGTLGNLATANNGVLITSGVGVPSIATTLPSGLTIQSPTFTGTAAGAGTIPTTLLSGTLTGSQMLPLATGDVYQGNVSNVPTAVTMSAALNAGIGSVASDLLYNNAGTWAQLATANNGVLKTSGAGVPSISTTLPSGLTAPALVVTGSFTATGLVTNADLANPSTTVNAQTCTLGSTCTVPLAVGSTTITSGVSNGILYDNAGVLGNLPTANNGVLITSGSGVPSISTNLPGGLTINGNPLTVANNASLKALTGSVAGNQVDRQGFSSAGDGGGATYIFSSSSCSLNSGAGDNGSQVKPTSGGGCWLAIFTAPPNAKFYGAVCNSSGTPGSGTDDTAAFQAADLAGFGVTVSGQCRIASAMTLVNPVQMLAGSALIPDTGVAVLMAGTAVAASLQILESPTGNFPTTATQVNIQGTTNNGNIRNYQLNAGLISNVGLGWAGYTGPGSNVAFYSGMECVFGTGACWGENPLVEFNANAADYQGTGVEFDVNSNSQPSGRLQGIPDFASPIDNVGLLLAGGGKYSLAAGMWVGNNGFGLNRGLYFTNDSVRWATVQDASNAYSSIEIDGAHAYGINLSGMSPGSIYPFVTVPGTCTTAPSLVVTGGSGAGAAGSLFLGVKQSGTTIASAGTGYEIGDKFKLVGGTLSPYADDSVAMGVVTAVNGSGGITGWSMAYKTQSGTTTLTSNVSIGTTVLPVASVPAGTSAGDMIQIAGADFNTYAVSTGGGSITIRDPLPRAAASGTVIWSAGAKVVEGAYVTPPSNPVAITSVVKHLDGSAAGSGATFSVTWEVSTVHMQNYGLGYQSIAPTLSTSGGGCSGVTVVAAFSGYAMLIQNQMAIMSVNGAQTDIATMMWLDNNNIIQIGGSQRAGGSGNLSVNTASGGQITAHGPFILMQYTVGTLPSCGSGTKGGFAYVTNGTSPTYGGVVSATGTSTSPVFCDGTNWTYH